MLMNEELEDCLLQGSTSLEAGRPMSDALWEGMFEDVT